MSSTRKRVALIVVILAVMLLYPFKKTLVPEQRPHGAEMRVLLLRVRYLVLTL